MAGAQEQQEDEPQQFEPADESTYPRPDMPGYSPPAISMPTAPAQAYGATYNQESPDDAGLIPPNVEDDPYATPGGGYCYVGPHPVDRRVQPGYAWDPTEGQHIRDYPPVDMRLFSFSDGCYYFIGDPRDFGYEGQTYAYYGAHPILPEYGGGWCFMMGGHGHLWRPWSPYFRVVGPWNYWQGPYDPFFWAYWPYYSFYYRSYYPHYYGGGRFYRGGGGYHVAPSIRSVPPSAWRGAGPGRTAPVIRGAPPTQMVQPATAGAYRGWGHSAGPAPAMSPGARPSFTPQPGSSPATGARSFSPSPRAVAPSPGARGSFHGGGHR